MNCRIDHIVITAPSLETGSDLVSECLGVRPQKGGKHPHMGTHNLLLRLGDETYLEVIAVDPAAQELSRPRWFALDTLPADARPRLACWVARTPDIRKSVSEASEALGLVEPMSRDALEWLITIPEDGSLPLDGVAPALVQWQVESHPASAMQDSGCRLAALQLFHPEPARVEALLKSLAVSEPGVALSVGQAAVPGLAATIRTPQGLRILGGMPTQPFYPR